MTNPTLADASDAIAAVVWGVQDLLSSKTLGEQAANIEWLSNHVSDLASWHPDYDVNTGEIPRDEA